MILSGVQTVGRFAQQFLTDAGLLWRLLIATGNRLFLGKFQGYRFRFRATLQQSVRAGFDSLPLVGLISVLVGMIVAFQLAYQLEKMGATSMVRSLVAITVTRELAPLLTAIIMAGRYGSAITAELGTMKVSQELDALTMMGIDPIAFLVVPRLLALIITLPCLIIFADTIGILGGMIVGVGTLGLGPGGYLASSLDALQLRDLFTGLVKAVGFGAIIGLVGCQQGLSTLGGAEGVGRSTTTSVVHSIVLIIGADLFVTALFYLGD